MAKRFTNEEIELLSKSPYVKNIRQNRLTFTYEFRCILYDEWIKQPSTSQIRSVLKSYGFDCSMLGKDAINKINTNFKQYGHPTNGKNKVSGKYNSTEKYDNESLIDSGIFVKTGSLIRFSSEFIDKAYKEYPSVSIESLLESYGLDPEKVGYQRIYKLKKKLEDGEKTKEKISADAVEKYSDHPYVQRCTPNHFTLKKQFYDESLIFISYPIDEILDIFEIDSSDFPARVLNRIEKQLRSWKGDTDNMMVECDQEFRCRIQHNRMRALEKLSMMHFERIRKILPSLTPEQKKALCIWIRDLPHDRYDYSIRSILKRIGISKSSYYSILSDDNYGMKERQDEIDFEYIRKVMDYKGFRKGTRTIYMMLPDICGVHFGRNKILRLMRKYNCICAIRRERTELKTNREILKNNRKPNLLKRRFRLARPGEILLTDVSYLKYGMNRTKYLSCVKDAVSGRVVSHITSSGNDLNLVMDTIDTLDPSEDAIFHSDQGSLYFNDLFQGRLKKLGYRQSMSRRGNCWDNASQESFFGHMKDECDLSGCSTPEEVKEMIDNYVYYYNNERPQWTRNKMTPTEYEGYLNSLSNSEYSDYLQNEQEKYDKMMKKAREKALKRAVELGALTEEDMELYGSGKKEEQAAADRGAETCA
ncbi:MAG: IS3 family transposase [Catenibacterium mitsuokai]|nr:IS3 family transposase [Catenibacterium mitsuokai]MBN2932718.1 IS3 family transposase [Catenibacterium mitsuokai]